MVCTGNASAPKVLIFDWDDTICPSSFVDRCNIENVRELPSEYQTIFSEIAKTAERCLEEASKYGEVIIITNSDDGWVKYSCERYVPELLPALDRYRVVSARTRYERFYSGQPLCWKAAAFAHEVNELYASSGVSPDDDEWVNSSSVSLESTDVSSDSGSEASQPGPAPFKRRREIISFGDAMEERTAVRIVAEQLSATPKSVMFIQSPTPQQIIGQLTMLTSHMKFVSESETNLDLEISPEQAERCAAAYLKRHKLSVRDSFQLEEDLAKMLIGRVEEATVEV